jgi:hypothetical protein
MALAVNGFGIGLLVPQEHPEICLPGTSSSSRLGA